MVWLIRMFFGLIGLALVGTPSWRFVEAFNVETKHYTYYHHEANSMFGFAVTAYRDIYGRGWAIVGAPESRTRQVDVHRPGEVFRCDAAYDDRCQVIHFDDKGNNHVRNPSVPGSLSQIDNKTLQWFGATVSASTKDGGPIVACAPRYIWFSVSQARQDQDERRRSKESTVGNRREPVGTCWVVTYNFTDPQEFSPCRTRYWGYHRQGTCQAGLGASMSKNGERLFIGAPGSWYWQGQLYSISTDMRFQFVSTTLFASEADAAGQVFSQPVNSRARVMFTKEGPASEDDSYMGYSVTTGDFAGNGDSGTAVGVPRGAGLRGKILLFTSNMTNHQNITGTQMGAYFGYSVASGDIDGDGLEDLIIGAPMYTIPDNPEMTIETGKVYVYYQNSELGRFRKNDSRDGESNRGRFGLSVASLGDIDLDGYGDFVVGAPYGGPNGRGVVYVYHGSRNGVLEKYSQAIYAEDLDVPVSTFGFSVAGGLDLDGNSYPDMVVGSYESSVAMVFRSRPVIKMDSYVTFDSESKLISLENRNCTLSDGTRATCIPLKACFMYTGQGVLPRHNFNIQYVLDVKKTKNPRLFFLELEGRNTMNHTITVEHDQQFCRTVQVYVTQNIRDKLTSLDAEMRMSLAEERLPDSRRRDPRVPLRPVLGTTTSRKDSLSIRKNCGADNICIPNLQMSVSPNVGRYLLGSGKKLELEIIVQNEGEDAFEATYNLKLPPGIDYIKIERIDKTEVPVQCSAPKQSNNNTLRCDIGNPLPQSQLVHFNVLLQPVTSHGMKPSYEFDMEVNTTNPEDKSTTGDNSHHLSLPIWIETELLVLGESKPKDLYYNPDNYTSENLTMEYEFGPAMIHNYTIRNQGPSEILEAEAFLVWPAQTLAGDELVYLMEQPETSGMTCEVANANYLSLKLEQRRRGYYNYRDSLISGFEDGKSIGVQRGFEVSQAERNKLNQKDEIDTSSGDSSNVQKYRHQSTSSTNTVSNNDKGKQLVNEHRSVFISGHSQNNSDRGSNGKENFNTNDDFTGGNRRVIVHVKPTTSHDGTTTVGEGFEGGGSSSGSRFENRWGETSSAGGGTISTSYVETDRRYQEVLRLQEEQRRRQQEEARARRIEEGRQRSIEMQRAREEEERRATLEQRRQQKKKEEEREEEMQRRRQQEIYEEERARGFTAATYGREGSFIAGDREETVGDLAFRLKNLTSTEELNRLFGTLSKEGITYETYNKQGLQYVQFNARFRTSNDRKEYIEFQDGSMFPLQDNSGKQSYASEMSEPRDTRYLRIEGQLMISQDGKGYIVLRDGRRFPLQGSYTYTEERTYNLGSGVRAGTTEERTREGQSWHQESSSRGIGVDPEEEYESRYSTHTYDERRTEERKSNSRVYGRDYERNKFEDGTAATSRIDPNHVGSRIRRESDAIDVDEFKKFERRRRHRRDIEESYSLNDGDSGDAFDDESNDYETETKTKRQIPPCEAAKCVTLRCTLGPLKKDQEVWIAGRYRVNARTLKKVAFNEKVKVSTQLVARVTKQPFIGVPIEQVIKSYETYTNVEPSAPPSAPDIVPLWIVVLSACAGTIILLLLIFLLYKCGFFKRNRPSDAPERQPLNRNGHFQHGDDHM